MTANPAKISKTSRFKQGIFSPIKPDKYVGKEYPVYRSSLELRMMKWLDTNPGVLAWNSEGAIVPYRSPVDGKMHRYFVDFLVKIKDRQGNITNYGIELKPFSQCNPPTTKNRKRLVEETATYAVNLAKWEAAKEFFKKNNAKFMVLTEKDIGVKY